MREIKFRCWFGGQMSHFDLEELYEEDLGTDGDRLMGSALLNKEVMQYTGLTDKNGKEIYEGDLIKCSYCDKDFGRVAWYNDMHRFQLNWNDHDCGNARHTRIDDRAEVIGNIYQNPDLIKIGYNSPKVTADTLEAHIEKGKELGIKSNHD